MHVSVCSVFVCASFVSVSQSHVSVSVSVVCLLRVRVSVVRLSGRACAHISMCPVSVHVFAVVYCMCTGEFALYLPLDRISLQTICTNCSERPPPLNRKRWTIEKPTVCALPRYTKIDWFDLGPLGSTQKTHFWCYLFPFPPPVQKSTIKIRVTLELPRFEKRFPKTKKKQCFINTGSTICSKLRS